MTRLLDRLTGGTTTTRVNLDAVRARRKTHPVWCHVPRCLSPYADPVGGHRSEPLSMPVPGVGKVVLTLTQRAGGKVHVEATVVAVAPGADARGQLEFAHKLLSDIAEAAASAAELATLTTERDQLLARSGRRSIERAC